MESLAEHFLLFAAWLGYYLLHSLLADKGVKQWLANRLGSMFRVYRIFYNILSLGLFGLLIYWQFSIITHQFFSPSAVTHIVGFGVLVYGAVVLAQAFFTVNLREFLGVEQLLGRQSNKPGTEGQSKLIRTGWYKYVRHPFYLGTVLMLIGGWLIVPTAAMLTLVGATFIYLPIGISLEERKLIAEFGDDYLKYRKEVKAILPFIL